jgi:hypothetical protein
MCECGCGELRPIAKIRGDGGWHFLEVYPGCTNGCGTSWGLGATWLADDDDFLRGDSWLLTDTPTVEYNQYSQWAMPILDTAKLVALFRQDEGAEMEDPEDYDAPADALHDFINGGGLIRAHHLSSTEPQGDADV